MNILFWRKKIDQIDQKLVNLFNQRARYAQKIGHLKKIREMAVHSPQREKVIQERVVRHNPGPLSHAAILRLFKQIIKESRKFEQESQG